MTTRAEPFLINPPKGYLGKIGSKHRPVAYRDKKGWFTSARARKAKRGIRLNPLGETLVTVGGNPMLAFANRKRGSRKRKRSRRRRNYYKNAFVNYRKRRYSRRRRNPQALGLRGATRVMNWGPLALTGAFSAVSVGLVPNTIGIVNPWAKLGVQVATAFVGGEMIRRFVGKNQGMTWMIVGTSMIMLDLLRTWLPRWGVNLPLGAYEDYGPDTDATGLLYGYPEEGGQADGVGAFTDQNLQGMGTYPEEFQNDPMAGMGAFPYPYGGQH